MIDRDKTMRFRDPKTGEVFENIFDARDTFCEDRYCGRCTMPNAYLENLPDDSDSCADFARNHPAEAARLMGLEVVEDEKLKGENEKMELKNTIEMMNSEDYKERFKAEYWQTKIRYEKLHKMCIKYEAGTLTFTPSCSLELLREQKGYMGNYLRTLEVRAEIEGICLDS